MRRSRLKLLEEAGFCCYMSWFCWPEAWLWCVSCPESDRCLFHNPWLIGTAKRHGEMVKNNHETGRQTRKQTNRQTEKQTTNLGCIIFLYLFWDTLLKIKLKLKLLYWAKSPCISPRTNKHGITTSHPLGVDCGGKSTCRMSKQISPLL